MDKVDSKTINYYYRNIRGSITNSLTNAEKTFIVNLKNKVNDSKSDINNNANNKSTFLSKLLKNWDKYVYTICILIMYTNYVNKFFE